MEKKLSFKEKVDIILRIKGINKKRVEEQLDVDGTFYKAYNENREPREDLLSEFLRKFHVKQSWWKDPIGTTEAEVFDVNPTPERKSTDSNVKPDHETVLKELIESNDKYQLVPTIILTNYEILSKNEIRSRENTQQEMINLAKEISATKQVVIDEKNRLISELENEIEELERELEKLRSAVPAQKA